MFLLDVNQRQSERQSTSNCLKTRMQQDGSLHTHKTFGQNSKDFSPKLLRVLHETLKTSGTSACLRDDFMNDMCGRNETTFFVLFLPHMSSGNEASLRINGLQCRMNPFLKNFSNFDGGLGQRRSQTTRMREPSTVPFAGGVKCRASFFK